MSAPAVVQVRGGADAVEVAAVLASLARLRRRQRRAPTGWRAVRLAALGLAPRRFPPA